MENNIIISGARENNLKNINVRIPHGKHTVIVGVSGCGKSSLAYDVIYAAGQKRLMDCLSSDQPKQLMHQMKQPDVDYIEGLTPVISLKQIKPRSNPRSTLGTVTEAGTYLRYIFLVLGKARCLCCRQEYPVMSLSFLVKELENLQEGIKIEIQIPYFINTERKLYEQWEKLRGQGYSWVYVNSNKINLWNTDDIITDEPFIMLVHSTLYTGGDSRDSEAILKKAVTAGNGFIKLYSKDSSYIKTILEKCGCPEHGMMTFDISPSFFSFNDMGSCCEECKGNGVIKAAVPDVLIQNSDKSLRYNPFYEDVYNMKKPYWYIYMYSLTQHFGIDFDTAFHLLSDEHKAILFYGRANERFKLIRPEGYDKQLPCYTPKIGDDIIFNGLVTDIKDNYYNRLSLPLSDAEENFFNRYMIERICPVCDGSRLIPHANYITLNGKSFAQLCDLEIGRLLNFVNSLICDKNNLSDAISVLNELKKKLGTLCDTGLDYLSLGRRIDTLSCGEYQRVRLSGQTSSGLTGLTYVIDEPTDGLHGSDSGRIINILNRLCHSGNTVITIEHSIDVIKSADHIIEMGPGAGTDGGTIIAEGSLTDIMNNSNSIIRDFLFPKNQPITLKYNLLGRKQIKIIGASENNLKGVDPVFPLNSLICVTGVSGSGKSTLVMDTLYKAILAEKHGARYVSGSHKVLLGAENVKNIYCIDQSPLNQTKTSIAATYINVFDTIRRLFSETESAKEGGLDYPYFSFNSKGCCHYCKGLGFLNVHIHYFGDLKTLCPECQGRRFDGSILKVKYNGRSIDDVLEMTFTEAKDFFSGNRNISHKLLYVCNMGLGYMKLGQRIDTVSGGEAQRLRLCRELGKLKGTRDMLYIMDEPTIGLHMKDIENFIVQVKRITGAGNTVVLIEHNPQMIMEADYIIDMGPCAGNKGGEIVFQGSPEDLMKCRTSKTSEFLKQYYSSYYNP